jgi:hypothetical protein
MADYHLTALRDFGNYRCGDHIEDDVEIARILGGEHCHHVVKVAADVKPDPEPAPPPLPKTKPEKDSA